MYTVRFVGLDVHKDSIVVAVADAGNAPLISPMLSRPFRTPNCCIFTCGTGTPPFSRRHFAANDAEAKVTCPLAFTPKPLCPTASQATAPLSANS